MYTLLAALVAVTYRMSCSSVIGWSNGPLFTDGQAYLPHRQSKRISASSSYRTRQNERRRVLTS
jgi:hypothetical protein